MSHIVHSIYIIYSRDITSSMLFHHSPGLDLIDCVVPASCSMSGTVSWFWRLPLLLIRGTTAAGWCSVMEKNVQRMEKAPLLPTFTLQVPHLLTYHTNTSTSTLNSKDILTILFVSRQRWAVRPLCYPFWDYLPAPWQARHRPVSGDKPQNQCLAAQGSSCRRNRCGWDPDLLQSH